MRTWRVRVAKQQQVGRAPGRARMSGMSSRTGARVCRWGCQEVVEHHPEGITSQAVRRGQSWLEGYGERDLVVTIKIQKTRDFPHGPGTKTPIAGGLGSITPDQGTRSRLPQRRMNILSAATKTQRSQINKKCFLKTFRNKFSVF